MLILSLVVIDYITGIIGACINGDFSSSKMREGLFHKLTYLIAVVVAYIIEALAVHYDLGFVTGIVVLVCTWIIITEVGSILENLIIINPSLADNSFMSIFARRAETNDLYDNATDKALDLLGSQQPKD